VACTRGGRTEGHVGGRGLFAVGSHPVHRRAEGLSQARADRARATTRGSRALMAALQPAPAACPPRPVLPPPPPTYCASFFRMAAWTFSGTSSSFLMIRVAAIALSRSSAGSFSSFLQLPLLEVK